MNIRNKLILAFLISTITPILLLCLVTGNSIRKDALQRFHETTNTELMRIEKAVSIFFNDIKENAVMVSKNADVMAVDASMTSFLEEKSDKAMKDFSHGVVEQRIIDFFHNMMTSHKRYQEAFMGTKFGGFIDGNTSVTLPAGYDPRVRAWYKNTMNAPETAFITKAYKSVTGNTVVSVCHAVSLGNERVGVAGFDISLKGLTEFISGIHIGKTGYVMLIQDDGVILANPGHADSGLKKLNEMGIPGLEAIANQSRGSLEIELDGKTYIAQIVTSDNIGWKFVGLIQKSEVMSKIYSLLSVMAIVGIALILVFVIMAFFMARSLSNPIIQITETIKEISQGNLTKRLMIHGKDELAELSENFNLFIENFQAIIGELKDNVVIVDDSSEELLTISNKMDASARTASGLVNTVSDASDEVNGNMTNIAAAMEQTTQNTNVVATASEEMSSTINEITQHSAQAKQISEQAVEQMQGASGKMHKLGNAAEAIGAVTDAIAGISDQTNLLALNATIEAARAGEAGKGFAVVANEIKELASQTADATTDIKEQIEGIQEISNETIEEIESVNTVMKEINRIIVATAKAIEEQSAATQEIASNIAQVSQGTKDVNENITQSSEAIDKISKDISLVDDATRHISGNSGLIVENLAKLKDMAKDLAKIVNQFQI